jgi:hypothetical protein
MIPTSYLGIPKVADLDQRPWAVVQQRVFELDVSVDNALRSTT